MVRTLFGRAVFKGRLARSIGTKNSSQRTTDDFRAFFSGGVAVHVGASDWFIDRALFESLALDSLGDAGSVRTENGGGFRALGHSRTVFGVLLASIIVAVVGRRERTCYRSTA